MAGYGVFAEISAALRDLLRKKMSPEPVINPSLIEVATPGDKNSDYTLGIYLYDIRENAELPQTRKIQLDALRVQQPPVVYSLHYLLYINADSQTGIKAIDAHKILGRAAQVMSDCGALPLPHPEEGDPPPTVLAAKLSFEEKSKLWTAINKPYSLSLEYKVYPVHLSSDRVDRVARVTTADILLLQRGEEAADGAS